MSVSSLKDEWIHQHLDRAVPMLPPLSAFYKRRPEQLDPYMKRLAIVDLDSLIELMSDLHRAGISIRRPCRERPSC